MKKIFAFVTVAAALLVAGNANAQLGVNVGYAPQTYNTVYTNGNNSTTTPFEMNGFFAGVNYNMPLSGDLCLSVGGQIRYNSKTEESSGGIGGIVTGSTKNAYSQMLLDIPVLLNYGLPLTSNLKLVPFIGATISYGLSGNCHWTATGSVLGIGGATEGDVPFYGEDGNWKNLELGGTIGVCVNFNDFRLFGGYNMGLVNMDKRDNYTAKGTNVFFGLGYAL